MRPSKLAPVVFALGLAIASLATAAKSATINQATNAIHENYDMTSIADLEETVQNNIICLALNQYHEARGSSAADIKAVGFSTRNRVKINGDDNFCDAIWEKGQYVWTKRPLKGIMPRDRVSWFRMVDLARDIVVDETLSDPTHGADSFFSRKIAAPPWSRKSPIHLIIGAHIYVRQWLLYHSAVNNEP